MMNNEVKERTSSENVLCRRNIRSCFTTMFVLLFLSWVLLVTDAATLQDTTQTFKWQFASSCQKGLEFQLSKDHRAPLSMKTANPRFICSGACAWNNNVFQSIQVLGTTTSEYMWADHSCPNTWININVAASRLYNHVLNLSTHYKDGQHSTLTCHYCQCQWWFDSLRAVPESISPANQDSPTKKRGQEDQTHDSNMWYSMKCSKVRLSNLFSSLHNKVSARIKRTLPCNNSL